MEQVLKAAFMFIAPEADPAENRTWIKTPKVHLLTIGEETFFATNYTKEELEALPDFDEKTVRK